MSITLKELRTMRETNPLCIPASADPNFCRCFKNRPVYDQRGRCIGYEVPEHDPNVVPRPEDVEPLQPDTLYDPSVYADVCRMQDTENVVTSPNVSGFDVADMIREAKDKF